jgi:CheY-like chemotaxis protein
MQKILVADDNLAVQRLISATLLEKGIEVLSVSTGPAALAVLESVQEDPPRLILADFNLEGMHLFTFVRKVQQDDRFSKIPMVALIHAIDSYDSVHLASVGIRGVLKKPLSAGELLKTIETHLPAQGVPAVLQETVPPSIVPALETAENVPTAPEMGLQTVVRTEAEDRLTEAVEMAPADTLLFNSEAWSALSDLPQATNTLAMMEGPPDLPSPASPADETVPVPDAVEGLQTQVVAVAEEAVARAVHQLLPGLLEAALTKEVIQTALEKVVREVVLPLAEAEIIREINRLQPEESF